MLSVGGEQPVHQPDHGGGVLGLHQAHGAAHQRHLLPVPGQQELQNGAGALVVHCRLQLPVLQGAQAQVGGINGTVA